MGSRISNAEIWYHHHVLKARKMVLSNARLICLLINGLNQKLQTTTYVKVRVCGCGTPWTFLLPFFFFYEPNRWTVLGSTMLSLRTASTGQGRLAGLIKLSHWALTYEETVLDLQTFMCYSWSTGYMNFYVWYLNDVLVICFMIFMTPNQVALAPSMSCLIV